MAPFVGDFEGVGDDDDSDCVEHVWRLEDVTFALPNLAEPGSGGSWSEYRCVRCDGQLLIGPGGDHPATV